MKKKITIKIIIALATILLSINTFAQSFYAKLNGGYNWGIASNIISRNSNQVGSVNSYEKVNLSFGKGINFSGAIGYLINKNIGVELGVSYLMGGTTENSSKSSSGSA